MRRSKGRPSPPAAEVTGCLAHEGDATSSELLDPSLPSHLDAAMRLVARSGRSEEREAFRRNWNVLMVPPGRRTLDSSACIDSTRRAG
jgi:hypothetical protein